LPPSVILVTGASARNPKANYRIEFMELKRR
jgi:hypothetical protein